MQFIDLATQQNRIREKIDSNIQAVMKHGQYIMGPEIKELEKRLANYVGIKHTVDTPSSMPGQWQPKMSPTMRLWWATTLNRSAGCVFAEKI